jgi:hypothetical protein
MLRQHRAKWPGCVVAYSWRSGYNISEPIAVAPVKVPLGFEFLYLLQHLLPLFLQLLQMLHVLLLQGLFLSAVTSRCFCISLPLFICFF